MGVGTFFVKHIFHKNECNLTIINKFNVFFNFYFNPFFAHVSHNLGLIFRRWCEYFTPTIKEDALFKMTLHNP